MQVRDFLESTAVRLPEKTAVVCNGRRWTYREIDTMADCLAQEMIELGVSRGDRVVIYLNNCIETVVSIFGVLKAGGVFVVVNRATKPDKLAYIVKDCRAAMVIADAKALLVPVIETAQDALSWFRGFIICGAVEGFSFGRAPALVWQELMNRGETVRPPASGIDLDLACLIYTSGTTGEPKGVMSDHSNAVFVSDAIITYLKNSEDDIVLNVLPLSHGYGLYQLLTMFRLGGTLVLENSFAFPAAILKLMEQERVTGLPGVPTLFAMLLQVNSLGFDLSALRYLTNAAAGLPPSHVLELHHRFPDASLYAMYGLTEVIRALYLPPEWIEQKPGSVGIAIPGTEVWLEDAGRRLGPGEIGELVVRGRHVMRGYWNAAELSARRFRQAALPGERLCYTDDLFRMDEDGFFYFVGRKDDIIKSRGEKVAPIEVESVLHELAGVMEAAVIGVPDPLLGQVVKAFIVRNSSELCERQVLAHCRLRLEDVMVPKLIEFRESLPKSPTGKVLKRELL